METILKEYLTALREEEALKQKKKELLKQLLRTKLDDGNLIADIVLNNKTYVKDLIAQNMPEDEEVYKAMYIRDELVWMKEVEDEIIDRYGFPFSPEGRITDGSHEGW
ncbi:MAG: hypothetical protein K2N88_02645 [Muribaculaceae bacterium]|nr:hypothetical protein [Muribaculaceae bacterium]